MFQFEMEFRSVSFCLEKKIDRKTIGQGIKTQPISERERGVRTQVMIAGGKLVQF